jgi:hypothetical protein
MRIASPLGLVFLFFFCPSARGQNVLGATTVPGSLPLEITVARPPSWHHHCLEVTIKRANRSKSRIYFPPAPFEGVKIYASVTEAKSMAELSGREEWILVYGWTDVIYSEGRTLASGRQEQKTYCIGGTFPVIDLESKATRQVRLQGRLRISAGYEQKVAEGRNAGRELTTPAKQNDSDIWSTGEVTIEIPIPCPVSAANEVCSAPLPIFPGEHDQWTTLPKPPVL